MPRVATQLQTGATFAQRFDGGLNLRDAPTQLAVNETPDCLNVTLDERGGAAARLGTVFFNPSSPMTVVPVALYRSLNANGLVAYDNTNGDLWKSTDGGVTWSTFYTTLTSDSTAQGAFIDFKDRLVFVNTIDGVYSFPSNLGAPTHTSGGTNNMEEVRGSAIALWQNKLWVTGDIREDATHSRSRVWWCAAGDELTWTVASARIDIRDVDTKICTAIGAGMGMDVVGKPGLLVYKEESVYRINDSTSGSYTTLHSNGAGAASNRAVASVSGLTCSMNRNGIWVTDGVSPPQKVSGKVQPLFDAGINFNSLGACSAAPWKDRIIFAWPSKGGTLNNRLFEYHPTLGWIVVHALAIGPMAVTPDKSLKGASSGLNSTAGEVYQIFTGGRDHSRIDGAVTSNDNKPIEAYVATRWVPLSKGDESRLRYMRIWGRGSVDAEVRTDFFPGGTSYPLTFSDAGGFVWDVDFWDVGFWDEASVALEGDATEPLDQVCKHAQLVFSSISSVSTSAFPRVVLSSDPLAIATQSLTPEIGGWAVYEAKLDYIQLGT